MKATTIETHSGSTRTFGGMMTLRNSGGRTSVLRRETPKAASSRASAPSGIAEREATANIEPDFRSERTFGG
jgi:hypothetical protein